MSTGFAIALFVLGAIGKLADWRTTQLISTAHSVAHTHEIIANLESLFTNLSRAEAGQRLNVERNLGSISVNSGFVKFTEVFILKLQNLSKDRWPKPSSSEFCYFLPLLILSQPVLPCISLFTRLN